MPPNPPRLGSHRSFSLEKKALTPREKQVARIIGSEGADYKTCAIKLNISPRTVETHLTNIYEKLGIHSKFQLMRLAFTTKLFSLMCVAAMGQSIRADGNIVYVTPPVNCKSIIFYHGTNPPVQWSHDPEVYSSNIAVLDLGTNNSYGWFKFELNTASPTQERKQLLNTYEPEIPTTRSASLSGAREARYRMPTIGLQGCVRCCFPARQSPKSMVSRRTVLDPA